MLWTTKSDNFTRSELACKCCGTIRYHEAFIGELERLREVTRPLPIISGCRCYAHNSKVGGHKNSLHLIDNNKHFCPAIAADVSMAGWDDVEKVDFYEKAKESGFSIGVKENSMHLDLRLLVGLEQRVFKYGYTPEWLGGVESA